MSIRYLSSTELLHLNAYLSQRESMPFGIQSLTALEAAVERPQLKLEGNYEPFPDIWQKAAALVDSCVKQKPFVKMNALTGFFGADLFLRLNGYTLCSAVEDLEYIGSMALQQETLPQIAAWLKDRATVRETF